MNAIIEEMARAESLCQLNSILSTYFAHQGISSLALTYYNRHTKSGNKLIYDWVSPPLKAWHQHYLDENYADIDRTLESSEQSVMPIYWNVFEQLLQAKNKREQRIRQESIEFGIAEGLCIPVYGPQGHFILLVLHQRRNEHGLKNWQEKQFTWLSLTVAYFHHLRRHLINVTSSELIKLTKREQQCLKLTASGLRIEAIAKALELSLRTVNFHLQNANKKLGVSNKYLAAMRWQNLE
ncbi:MAG: LuxR C-terminal-related transcriptional regulator [Legionella sp.]|nr:LuxR C-terminal-related transcriptional regulator [Legionella sp.]